MLAAQGMRFPIDVTLVCICGLVRRLSAQLDEVLKHLMAKGEKVADSDRLGKTIVFAKNNDHAVLLKSASTLTIRITTATLPV